MNSGAFRLNAARGGILLAMREVPISAFVLAGGKSTRMGTDKALVEFNGRSLLDRALELTRSITPDVRIVGDPAKYSSFAPVIEDIYSNCGPLAGIHAALRSSGSDLSLILAVDNPFLLPAFLHLLVRKAIDSAALVIVPHTTQGWQPLCAVYRRPFADLAEKSLLNGRCKIDMLFDPAHTQVLTEEELQSAGFSTAMFRNLNTPQDLAQENR